MKRTLASLFVIAVAMVVVFGAMPAQAREGGGPYPASMMLFPYWDETGTMRTVFRITNIGPNWPVNSNGIYVNDVPLHIIFVSGEDFGCGEWDYVERFTAGEAKHINVNNVITSSFSTAMGFAIAYVGDGVDKYCWDEFIGDWWIVDTENGNIFGDNSVPSRGVQAPGCGACVPRTVNPNDNTVVIAHGYLGLPTQAGGPGDDEVIRYCSELHVPGGPACTAAVDIDPITPGVQPGHWAEYESSNFPGQFFGNFLPRFRMRHLGFLRDPQGNRLRADRTEFVMIPMRTPGTTLAADPLACDHFAAADQQNLCFCYDPVIWNAWEVPNSLPDRMACCWRMERLDDITDDVSENRNFFKLNGDPRFYGWLDFEPEACVLRAPLVRTDEALFWQLEGINTMGQWGLYTPHPPVFDQF